MPQGTVSPPQDPLKPLAADLCCPVSAHGDVPVQDSLSMMRKTGCGSRLSGQADGTGLKRQEFSGSRTGNTELREQTADTPGNHIHIEVVIRKQAGKDALFLF